MKKLPLVLFPFLLLGCETPKKEPTFIDYVNVCAISKFTLDYEDREIITYKTIENQVYYLTDIYYKVEYENDIYKTEYISSVNNKSELIIKEIKI